jgi:hypothetical protein
MNSQQAFVAVAAAGGVVGLLLAFAAGRWPRARALGVPAFLLVAVAGFALVLALAGPIAWKLLGLS